MVWPLAWPYSACGDVRLSGGLLAGDGASHLELGLHVVGGVGYRSGTVGRDRAAACDMEAQAAAVVALVAQRATRAEARQRTQRCRRASPLRGAQALRLADRTDAAGLPQDGDRGGDVPLSGQHVGTGAARRGGEQRERRRVQEHRPSGVDVPDADDLDQRFKRLFGLRDAVYKELEAHRQQGEFGKSLEAALVLAGDRAALDEDLAATRAALEELCIVSQVAGGEGPVEAQSYPGLRFGVRRAEGTTCPRCWQVCADPPGHERHPELCPRCLAVVLALERERSA